jgi:hypothetical protein
MKLFFKKLQINMTFSFFFRVEQPEQPSFFSLNETLFF